MTPQFTTPCFVRVDDAQQAKELFCRLDNIGYENGIPEHWVIPNDEPLIISAEIYDDYCEYCWYELSQSNIDSFCDISIDCGTNTDLFLALAGMRSDTDKGQWFVFLPTGILHCYMQSTAWPVPQAQGLRRATAEEIIEHFEKKGE